MALIITIIILLILAGISLSGLIGEKGLFKRTENASNRYKEAKAREVLEILLLADGQYEKNTNPKYNQDDFLDELIKSEIPGSKVIEDIAIVDGYGYELDRSVPKIGHYVGKEENLVWPKVNATEQLADDKKTSTITITASEEKKGINKIEIWLLGEMIKEYTYDPAKPEATENYIATQNGKYKIKAYSDLMASTTVEVTGIVASVKFDPNSDETCRKLHSTTVTIEETADKVVNARYQWINSVATPDDNQFPTNQTFKSGDTITKDGVTGTYYLWTRLETESGEILKWRSEGFNFDNQGPQITAFTSTAVNYTSFKLNITAIDDKSGITEYEFFVEGRSKGKKTVSEVKISNSQELTVTDAKNGDNSCYVIVKDKAGNETRKDITAKTLVDTTPPTITAFEATKYSIDGITLSATAQDTGTGVVKFVFSIGSITREVECTATTSSITKSVTITGLDTGSGKTCKVIVYDAKDNSSSKSVNGSTKMYAWKTYTIVTPAVWEEVNRKQNGMNTAISWAREIIYCKSKTKPKFNTKTGWWEPNNDTFVFPSNNTSINDLIQEYGVVGCYVWRKTYNGEGNIYWGLVHVYEPGIADENYWRNQVSEDVWGNEKVIYTTSKNEHTDGEIVNGVKYKYDGIK